MVQEIQNFGIVICLKYGAWYRNSSSDKLVRFGQKRVFMDLRGFVIKL